MNYKVMRTWIALPFGMMHCILGFYSGILWSACWNKLRTLRHAKNPNEETTNTHQITTCMIQVKERGNGRRQVKKKALGSSLMNTSVWIESAWSHFPHLFAIIKRWLGLPSAGTMIRICCRGVHGLSWVDFDQIWCMINCTSRLVLDRKLSIFVKLKP